MVDHGFFGLDLTSATCYPKQTSDTHKLRSSNTPNGTFAVGEHMQNLGLKTRC